MKKRKTEQAPVAPNPSPPTSTAINVAGQRVLARYSPEPIHLDSNDTRPFRISVHVPAWFAIVAAVIYAAGFLIEFNFFNAMGIKETVADVFKAKYVYLGLLCLTFPASVLIVLVRALRVIKAGEDNNRYAPGMIAVLNLFFAFYLLVAFSQPGFLEHHQAGIAALFCLGVGGLIIIYRIEKFLKGLNTPRSLKGFIERAKLLVNPLRWMICIGAAILTTVLFWDLWPLLWEMLSQGAWLYIMMMLAIALTVLHISWEYTEAAKIRVISITIALLFSYLSILVFSARLYPYIPVERGGGDYSREAKLSVLLFDRKLVESIPADLLDTTVPPPKQPGGTPASVIQSKPVILLDQSSAEVFLTIPHSAPLPSDIKGQYLSRLRGELVKWRMLGPEHKPSRVFALRREAVICIITERQEN